MTLESQRQVEESTRFEEGLKVQKFIFGDVIDQMQASAPVKAHVKGNLNVGNDKELMIEAITQCLLYMGFPRTLNALNCVNEMAPEETKECNGGKRIDG